MKTAYETERLYLKILSPDNAGDVLSFLSYNKEIFEPYEPAKPSDYYTLDYQSKMLSAEYNGFLQSHYLRYYAIKKEDCSIIGTVSFSNILPQPFDSCAIGYKIDKSNQRQGYATEMLICMQNAMFNDFGIRRIEAYVLPQNVPSINLLESLGYKNKGLSAKHLSVNGKINHLYHYSLSLSLSRSLF